MSATAASDTAAVTLLSEARAHRERAHRAREVAKTMYQRDVIDLLERFAREFEHHAEEIEQRVRQLGQESVARTARVAAEINEKVARATESVKQLQQRLARTRDGSSSDGQGT